MRKLTKHGFSIRDSDNYSPPPLVHIDIHMLYLQIKPSNRLLSIKRSEALSINLNQFGCLYFAAKQHGLALCNILYVAALNSGFKDSTCL